MHLETIFRQFSTDFSFVEVNNIEYCTADISDDCISFFTITLSNRNPA